MASLSLFRKALLPAVALIVTTAGMAPARSCPPEAVHETAHCLSQDVRIAGVVLAANTERPIRNAEVIVGSRSARADSNGRFSIANVPVGNQTLVVRAVGFQEISEALDVPKEGIEELELVVEPIIELRRVETRANAVPLSRNLQGFEQRRKMGIGRFLDSTQLALHDTRDWATEIVRRVSSIQFVNYSGRRSLASSRGRTIGGNTPRGDISDSAFLKAPRACYVKIVLDGIQLYGSMVTEKLLDVNTLGIPRVAAAEFYTVAQTPPEFNRNGNAPCGTLLIWTH
ncbi:MAG TPA: carboxypeptidase regulatory-like domain-containing protein [Gemmatimonas sp.]|uniref:carboxypeptidase regulatory-like domain-containing protein n=1 Tax=Gemmatimonas sp. TaxID=1962908 RepID=UPI002EDB546F